MSVVLDTSMVVALLAADDDHHREALDWVLATDEDLITTPLALAEMDHLAGRRGGADVAMRLWADFENGAYGVRWWADGMAETIRIARRHPFLGLTSASLVALAGLLHTDRIATFDDHFRSVFTPGGEAFVVLPADA